MTFVCTGSLATRQTVGHELMRRATSRARRAASAAVWLSVVSTAGTMNVIELHAQSRTGSLQGAVRATASDAPLPYAVVKIPALAVERFTDGRGRFTLTALPSGTHDVLIRRIGFSPWRGTVRIVADSATQLDIHLEQLPQRLEAVAVREMASCRSPGPPDPTLQRETFSLVSQLRENAERYRLLAEQYPFAYSHLRGLGELRDSVFVMQHVDTTIVQSITRVAYRPGSLVIRTKSKERGEEFSMAIPTLIELSDDAFIRVHCFGFGGTIQVGTETWVRVNMRAADKLRSPDVHGAFFLDSATSELRRMDLDMSRPDLLPVQLQRVDAVHVVTSFREIAAGLSVIESVCAVNQLRRPPGADELPAPAELHQLLAYRFTTPPPDVPIARAFISPLWVPGAKLQRDVVWCEQ